MSPLALSAAQAPDDGVGLEFFERKVRPLFAEHCVSCHGPEKQKSGLRLDSSAGIQAGGERGPILIPGQPEQSRLLIAVGYQDQDLQMPPKNRLAPQQVADLKQWIQNGAALPKEEFTEPSPAPRAGFQMTSEHRQHWAFQPLRHPVPPRPSFEKTNVVHPINAFIQAGLRSKGLKSNPPAEKQTLIRRAYYDLTGLPPTPADVEAFLADTGPRAWENLVDRLLASPRYGEKWGRHWLDLVRFAESNSYERDGDKPHAWRYRDYIIRSFNDDKPYDRFLIEQLAGDELPEADRDPDALIATGFYRLGIWDDEPVDRELARFDGLDDVLTTVGQVFLGLTVDCARCHDHKMDPIPQRDYYRLLSFFNNINHYRNGGPTDEAPLRPDSEEKALVVTEHGSRPPDTFVLLRGNPNVRGDQVEPGFPEVLGAPAPRIDPPASNAQSCGRRIALARWIASPDNPLTARVMVNRVWQYHFGRGLVRSPNNFGLQGDRPTHPELLDWLAGEFIANGWRLKPLHRLIMTSQAYRMSSVGRPEALRADPENDAFWRFDMRRLSAEEIRDSLLAITGTLNFKMYGPGIYVDIPKEVLAGQSRPGNGWGQSSAEEQARRSIYIHVKRSLLTPILESFDLAETDRTTPVRFATVQPTQALGMLNSDEVNHQARLLAARLRREAGDDPYQQVRLGLYLATSRVPSAEEIQRGIRLIQIMQNEDQTSADTALYYFCLMALNLNEMVYLD